LIDPISLATVTAALTVLGTETAKGVASEAGKNIWTKTKDLLGWTTDPDATALPKAIAARLHGDEALFDRILTLLQDAKTGDTSVQMVGPLR